MGMDTFKKLRKCFICRMEGSILRSKFEGLQMAMIQCVGDFWGVYKGGEHMKLLRIVVIESQIVKFASIYSLLFVLEGTLEEIDTSYDKSLDACMVA